jgi:uncharacterized repeat protein (TIGR04138 family)
VSENILDRIRVLALQDRRYAPMAYIFVFEALDYTVEHIAQAKRHVTGRELLEGIRLLAVKQFGPMAKMVFNVWGVYKTQDFGTIVFNLVSEGLMGKTDNDSIEDFTDIYDFEDAFSLDRTVQLNAASQE